MSQISILVVDDENEIADLVEIYLVSDGYRVFKANNAQDGLNILEKEEVHLVLLDIMMPGMDGLEMCKRIRETNNIPIIMLSARSTDLDKILGLGTGADDYVVKPFNPLELTARVKSQLRRYTQLNPNSTSKEEDKNEISIKGLVINKDNHKVTVYGEEIKLTPIEFDILYLLASNPGKVITNIIISTMFACLVDLFLVTNLTMLGGYAVRQGREGSLQAAFYQPGSVIILLYVLAGIATFSVAFLLLQKKSMDYITRISVAVQNISEGDLNTTVEVVGDDEFSAMAANLNKMVEDIRQLMDKERESERTKNELITNIAHDLRTPLTSIIGYLELLSGPANMTEEMEKKYIDITYTKAKRLEKLIEDLFGFTKLNYGKVSMKIGKVDIVKLLSQLLEEFYPNFMDNDLAYELQSNVPAKIINADGNLLARLFDNLINNAIKYGAEGKRIVVKIHATETMVTVSVTNYGYVIPKEELPLLFEKFYRVEQSRSSNTGGTGLGLAIARNIVDMHGGTIGVVSDLNGTVFTVRLQADFDINRENFGRPGDRHEFQ